MVLVEDTAELVVGRHGVVRLEARPANVEGAGAISLRDLVRQALRMRPDRLVVGEVRGGEVVDLLVALNTGHAGALSTVHANSAQELPHRMEALATLAGVDRPSLHSLLGAGIDVAVHLRRDRDGTRRVAEIGVAHVGRDGLVHIIPAITDLGSLAHVSRSRPAAVATAGWVPGDGRRVPGEGRVSGEGRCVPGAGHGELRRLLIERGVHVPSIIESEATRGYGQPPAGPGGAGGAEPW